MTTTPNMALDKPVVSSTAGPLWATMLNAISDQIDAHDHTTGKGPKVPTAGLNINAALTFASNDATALRSTRFSSQSAVFSLAADVGCVYVKSGELYYRDLSGANVQITSGGVLNAAALNANTFPQQDLSADFAITSTNANAHFSVDASIASRIITLPKAADVSAGRFYIISDRLGGNHTITIQREGSTTDTIDGASSVVINIDRGSLFVVRTSSSTWQVICRNLGATSTAFGQVRLTGDLGGSANVPAIVSLTGSGGVVTMTAASLLWSTGASPGSITSGTAAASTAGANFAIQAQNGNATGTTAGGTLQLKGGAAGGAGTGHGGVALLDGAGNEVASALYATNPYFRVKGSGGLLFEKGVDGNVGFEPLGSVGAGHSLGITAQSGLTTGLGGNIQMNAGNGAAAAGGSISLLAGSVSSGSGSNGGSVSLVSGAGIGTGLPGSVSMLVNSFNSLTALALASAQRVVAISEFPTTTHLPAGTGDGVLWVGRAAVPASSSIGSLPTRGFTLSANASDHPFFANPNGTLAFTMATTTAGFVTGTGSPVATGPTGFIQVLVNGVTKNIPFYN